MGMIVNVSNIEFYNGVTEVVTSGKVRESRIVFSLPLGIPIPIFKNQKIELDEFDCSISIHHSHPNPKSTGSFVFSGNSFLDNDRWGRSFFTQIKIKYKYNPPKELHKKFNDELFEKSLLAVNKLLKIIRNLISDHYIPQHIIKADIESYKTQHFDIKNKEIIGSGGLFAIKGEELKLVTGGFNIKQEIISEIKNKLEITETIPIHQELIRNAEDYLFLEQYRTVVIESESAIEALILKIIRDGETTLGRRTSEEIENLLLQTGFKNLIIDHLKNFTSEDFTSTFEHDEWWEKGYGLRNKVVHNGYPPTPDEAKESMNVIKNALNKLEFISQTT